MNIISYSLFEPKTQHTHRFWDANNGEENRYWFNIESLHIINKILYPDFTMRIYASENIKNNKSYSTLEKLKRETDLQIYFSDEEYSNHEPASWRIKPLWDSDADHLLVRDLDSVPNIDEYKATRYFLDSAYTVSTIRSHENHYQYPCRMLIGLSSFKPKEIPEDILCSDFENFRAKYTPHENKWDNDQIALIKAFTDTNTVFTMLNFLDFKINNQKNDSDFSCQSGSREDIDTIELTDQQKKLLCLVDEYKLSDWAGQPCDARGSFLNKIKNIQL